MAQSKQRKPRTEDWQQSLRRMLKASHGTGWSVREIRGRTQITIRWADGGRSSVVTATPWAGPSAAEILALVGRLEPMVMERRLPLADAYRQLVGGPTKGQPDAIDWAAAIEAFRQHKLHSGAISERTWRRMYRPHMRLLEAVTSTRPAPRDGKALLAALVKKQNLPPGSRSRQVACQQVSGLLRFIVGEQGAPDQWLPPTSLRSLVGQALTVREPSVPIRDPQLVVLLNGMEDPRRRLAVGLMAVFGLRPWELNHCRPERGKLVVTKGKRTQAGISKPRAITGLDPVGRPGLALELLAQLEERGSAGLPKLPEEGPGTELWRQLRREPAWCALVEEEAAEGRQIVPYSCRHGYALRAHEHYGLSPRVTATLMGHGLPVHLSSYGQWADAGTVDEAIARAAARLAVEQAAPVG